MKLTLRIMGWIFCLVWVFSSSSALGATDEGDSVSPSTSAAASAAVSGASAASAAARIQAIVEGAQAENPQALFQLGTLYEQGVGVERNYGQALALYKKAAEYNIAEACYNVGMCYEIGMGAAPDPVVALVYFERAASLGLPQGVFKSSYYYRNGQGVTPDEEKAFLLLQQAVDANYAVAVNDLGVVFTKGMLGQAKDERKGVELFIRAADLGSVEGMKNIGVAFRTGVGRTTNNVKALKWFIIATHYGYPAAQARDELEASMSKAEVRAAYTEADEWIGAFDARTNSPTS